MTTVMSNKGQIILPAEIRKKDGIEPGETFEIERLGLGDYRLVRVSTQHNEGLVDWLLSCPQKGYFTAIPSESSDTL